MIVFGPVTSLLEYTLRNNQKFEKKKKKVHHRPTRAKKGNDVKTKYGNGITKSIVQSLKLLCINNFNCLRKYRVILNGGKQEAKL